MKAWDAKSKSWTGTMPINIVVLLDDYPAVTRHTDIREARELCDLACTNNPFMRAFILRPGNQWQRSVTDYKERKIMWEQVVEAQIPAVVRLATTIA